MLPASYILRTGREVQRSLKAFFFNFLFFIIIFAILQIYVLFLYLFLFFEGNGPSTEEEALKGVAVIDVKE